jgi:hypothetical protein
VEQKLGSIIWCHLFKDIELVGKAGEGFHLAIETTAISETKKEGFKTEVALLIPDCLKIDFSGSYSIEPEKFMRAVGFETTINKVHQKWFSRAIYEMTNVFITRLEFLGGSRISVALLDRADDLCLQATIYFS